VEGGARNYRVGALYQASPGARLLKVVRWPGLCLLFC